MATLHADGNNSSFSDDAPPPTAADRRRGGWITTPFILAAVFGLTLASGGWSANLIVFLINEYNIKSIDAAQINNVVSGCTNFFPLVGAVLADSLLGCFSVIFISSLISLLGLILLVLTVTVDGLKPAACEASASAAALCAPPSRAQYVVVCSAVGLASIGVGGTRFTLVTMGANQFEGMQQQASYFNWFFFTFYAAASLSSTAIVYVEDNLGWGWGFWIGLAANVVGLALFFIGAPYYTRDNPRTSPFTGLLRVVVASIRNRKAIISSQPADYYYGDQGADADAPNKLVQSDSLNLSGFSPTIIVWSISFAPSWTSYFNRTMNYSLRWRQKDVNQMISPTNINCETARRHGIESSGQEEFLAGQKNQVDKRCCY